jgi:hypothetical protein
VRLSDDREVDALLQEVCVLVLVDEKRANRVRKSREPPSAEAFEEYVFKERKIETVRIAEVMNVRLLRLAKGDSRWRMGSKCTELLQIHSVMSETVKKGPDGAY